MYISYVKEIYCKKQCVFLSSVIASVSKLCSRCDRCLLVSHRHRHPCLWDSLNLCCTCPSPLWQRHNQTFPFIGLFSFSPLTQTTPFQQKNINQAILATSFVADCKLCLFAQMLLPSPQDGVSKTFIFLQLGHFLFA